MHPFAIYIYNEQTIANLIDSFIIQFFIISPQPISVPMHHLEGPLTQYLLSYINVFMQTWDGI